MPGWSEHRYQRYSYKICNHFFRYVETIGIHTLRMVEYVAYMHLRSLSFNQVIAILGAYYQQGVFTKHGLVRHIEQLADRIPENRQISQWSRPRRSGYYALDGA